MTRLEQTHYQNVDVIIKFVEEHSGDLCNKQKAAKQDNFYQIYIVEKLNTVNYHSNDIIDCKNVIDKFSL